MIHPRVHPLHCLQTLQQIPAFAFWQLAGDALARYLGWCLYLRGWNRRGPLFCPEKASLSCPLRLWVGFGRTTFTVSSGLLQHLARCSFREVRTKLMGPRPFVQAFESQFRCAELPTEQDTTGKNEWIEIAEQGFLRSGATGDSPHVASNRRGMR